MSEPLEPKEGNGHDDVIDAWIHSLQGRETVSDVTGFSRAGALLRRLLLQAQRDLAQADAAYEQGLIDEWMRVGLIGSPPRSQVIRNWVPLFKTWLQSRSGRVRIGAFAIACLVMGVVANFAIRLAEPGDPDQDASIMRGIEAPQRVWSNDPDAFALQVITALRRNQITVRRTDLPSGSVQLQAKLPSDAGTARRELTDLGITLPAHERLNLLISKLE